MVQQQEITIYDLAKKLNVSAATVSRALNGHSVVSEKTAKRIRDLAKEMGYRSNNFASNLRLQKTNTIGVLMHELNSNFITSVLSGIEKVTAAAGYDIIIGHSAEKSKKEIANANNFFHKRVDGLIASLAYDTKNMHHFDPFIRKGIPIVFVDRVENESGGIKVVIDNYKAGYQATEHLITQGCKRIMHITGNTTRNVYADRLRGYKAALADHNLAITGDYIIINDLSEEASIDAAQLIIKMKKRPDGLFVTNDFCAAVCMQQLKEAGIKVPQDIAIVGFNNDVISKLVAPKLTTINYPGREVGEVAARNLVNHLTGTAKMESTYTITLRSDLIIRASSLKNGR